jgi:hypothetical protein
MRTDGVCVWGCVVLVSIARGPGLHFDSKVPIHFPLLAIRISLRVSNHDPGTNDITKFSFSYRRSIPTYCGCIFSACCGNMTSPCTAESYSRQTPQRSAICPCIVPVSPESIPRTLNATAVPAWFIPPLASSKPIFTHLHSRSVQPHESFNFGYIQPNTIPVVLYQTVQLYEYPGLHTEVYTPSPARVVGR